MSKGEAGHGPWKFDASEELRARPGFTLADFDRRSTPGFARGRDKAAKLLAEIGAQTSDLQERLFAHGRTGGSARVLLVLQGLDTSGKGGILRHVVGMVDPQGVALHAFGVPTEEERRHHYLWRIRNALPPAGRIGVFDRSHYEEVLVARVESLVPADVWERRYDEINDFEAEQVAAGTRIVKAALMVSREEQFYRLMERLDRPDKHWKFNPADVDARARWDAYQEAYQAVFDRTSTEIAPWHVIPADEKWYARLAVSQLLWQALDGLGLTWPAADYDVEEQRRRLTATR